MNILRILDRIRQLEIGCTPRRIAVVHFGKEADAAERLAELQKDDDPNLVILSVHYVSSGAASEGVQV